MEEAQIQVIEYSKLHRDEIECSKLFKACCDDGVFYMDLSDINSSMHDVIADIYELQRRVFDLPITDKMCYDIDTLSARKLNGYGPRFSIETPVSRLICQGTSR